MSNTLRVLITGAARGIGMATAQVLANRGHSVVATDVSPLSGSGGIQAHVLDVASDDSVARCLEEVGPLDAIVNNAAIFGGGPVEGYSRAEEGEIQAFVSVIMDEFSPFAYENFAHILQTARGANVAFLFALQSAPQLLQVGRGFRNDVASAPNTTFMLRTKDEETAKYFLNASARVRQMRRSMRVEKKGLFKPEFEEGTEGSQTEIKDTLAQDEHIKKMPVGQMEMLMTVRFWGQYTSISTSRKPVHSGSRACR